MKKEVSVHLTRTEKRVMGRAKQRLMDEFLINENQAYQWIIHTAMEFRLTKIQVALKLLKEKNLI